MVRFFKLIFLLLIATSLRAQGLLENKVTLDERNKSIEYILQLLESDQLSFTYSSELLDVKRRTSIKVSNQSVEDVLNQLFMGQNVEFMTMSNQIIIKKKVIPQQLKTQEEVADVEQSVASSTNNKQLAEVSQPKQSEKSNSGLRNKEERSNAVGGGKSEKTIGLEGERTVSEVISIEKTDYPVAAISAPTISWNLTSPEYSYTYKSKPQPRDIPNEEPISSKNTRAQKAKKPDPEPSDGIRFSGSIFTSITNIAGDAAILMGGRGLYYLTPELGVGFGGAGFISPRYVDDVLGGEHRITGGYGGLFAEYSFRPMRKFHINYHVLVAGGGAVYFQEDIISGIQPEQLNSPMFVLEPGLTLELNVIKWFRIGLDATYRYNSAGSVKYPNSDDVIFTTESLRSFNVGVSLKFGRF